MDNKEQHIDKLFKEKLNQRTFEVPEAFLTDLENRLDKRKERKGIWLFLTLIAIVGIGVGGFFLIGNQNKPLNTPLIVDSNQKFAENKIDSEKSESSTEKRNNFIQEEFITNNGVESAQNEVGINVELAKKENYTITTKTKEKSPNSIEKNSSKNQDNLNVIAVKENQVKIKEINNRSIKLPQKDLMENENIVETSKNSSHDKEDEVKSITQPQIEIEEHVIVNGVNSVDKETEEAGIETDSIQPKPEISEIVDEVVTSDSINRESFAIDMNKVTTPEKFKKWSFEVQLLGGIGTNFFSDKSSNDAYLKNLREGHQSILLSNYGIRGNFNLGNFTFGTGIEMTEIGEKYKFELLNLNSYESTITQIDTVDQLVSYYQPWGEWMYDTIVEEIYTTADLITITDTTKTMVDRINRYHWVSIPLHFGYTFHINRFAIIPRIGVQFNFARGIENGLIPNESFTGYIDYKATQFNMSYSIDLEIRRTIKNWHVFIAPYFRSNFSPVVREDLLQRKYSSWGMNLGVGYRF